MRQLIILIGISGSGKSTIAKEQEKVKQNTKRISSDELRLQLYGTLSEGNQHNARVFEIMNKTVFKELEEKDAIVYYDATNLSRKRRAHLYQEAKRRFTDVKVICQVVFCNPELAKLRQTYRIGDEAVPNDVIERQFMNLQVPRVSVDCDDIVLSGECWFDKGEVIAHRVRLTLRALVYYATDAFKPLLKLNYAPHESKWHTESIDVHILAVNNTAVQRYEAKDTSSFLAAAFHDLGKGYVKNRGINFGTSHYLTHEAVGAQILLNAIHCFGDLLELDKEECLEAVERVYQHMIAHQIRNGNWSEKTIKKWQVKHDISDELLINLLKFAEIDALCSIPVKEEGPA
ncbi:ATP-binding protein [Lactococcus allomyrinae]|nr:ATP-binding protein [Lactococcus allomyrinae]